ncbi:unnamed protein product [Acanthoscelides obtectus]|uniref:Uncharacterized protein n=1 Tax=Acanthoscelides obtectus TaxID=200917 RepID=A0A9P0L5Z0_ACAOB|nr:unnamed protein product [Acanthoscelides obtectus]CAK1640537.1 hypothetical protein AOBTE_LOCUS11783 [Acanthoscelides obtectus]
MTATGENNLHVGYRLKSFHIARS